MSASAWPPRAMQICSASGSSAGGKLRSSATEWLNTSTPIGCTARTQRMPCCSSSSRPLLSAMIVALAPWQKLTKPMGSSASSARPRTYRTAAITSRYSSRPTPVTPPLGLSPDSPWLRKSNMKTV